MRNIKIKTLLGCFLFGAMGCSQGTNTDEPINNGNNETPKDFVLKERKDILLSGKQLESVNLQNTLAFKLASKDNRQNNGNTLLSPVSISLCLSIAANGASNDVRDEIINVLLPTGGDLDALNTFNKILSESLMDVDNSAQLNFANSVWANSPYTIHPDFSTTLTDFYTAETANIAMHTEAGRDAINSWVANTTRFLIPYLFTGIPTDDLLLINTIYFKGEWTVPFDKSRSEKAKFNNTDGKLPEVTYMKSDKEDFMYDINSSYSSVRLPYGNEAYSMYAVMPTGDNDIYDILGELTPEKWEGMKRSMSPGRGVYVNLPVFEVEYDADRLKEYLMECGIKKLFTSKAALINTVSPYPEGGEVSIFHKTVFKVDELGAEGAALTSLGTAFDPEPGTVDSPTPPTITFDRPFLYIVEEQSTGAILFIGAIRNL